MSQYDPAWPRAQAGRALSAFPSWPGCWSHILSGKPSRRSSPEELTLNPEPSGVALALSTPVWGTEARSKFSHPRCVVFDPTTMPWLPQQQRHMDLNGQLEKILASIKYQAKCFQTWPMTWPLNPGFSPLFSRQITSSRSGLFRTVPPLRRSLRRCATQRLRPSHTAPAGRSSRCSPPRHAA